MKPSIATIVIVTAAIFTGWVAGPALAEEKWSLKKINPLGDKDTQAKSRFTNPAKWVPSIGSSNMIRPITPAGFKENVRRIGDGTRSAFGRTREALTPKLSWPKLKMPSFGSSAEREPRTARKSGAGKSSTTAKSPTHSLVSWFLPEKELSPKKGSSK